MMMPLESNRILLRKYKLEDLDDYCDYIMNDKVTAMVGFEPYSSKEAALERLKYEMEKPYHFAIVLKEENKVVGSIQLAIPKPDRYSGFETGNNPYEYGYLLSEKYWGMELMAEANVLMNDFAFKVLNASKIMIGHADKNGQSGRVQDKIGFKIIGEKQNYRIWTDGTNVSLIVREMTPETWDKIREEKFIEYVK